MDKMSDDELRAFRVTLAPARRLCQGRVVRYSALATSAATPRDSRFSLPSSVARWLTVR